MSDNKTFPLSDFLPYRTTIYPATDAIRRPPGWVGHQRDAEFHPFVDRLIEYKCESLLFIGVANGGNQLYIGQRYRDLGLKCRMLMVDIRLNLGLAVSLQMLKEACPDLEVELLIANSQQLRPRHLGQWDAGFVDGDHGYPQTLNDVRLSDAVVRHFTGVHDVTNLKGQEKPIPSVEAWQVLKQGRRVEEFFTDWQMGIGILYKDDAP